jgi:cell division protein FtsB
MDINTVISLGVSIVLSALAGIAGAWATLAKYREKVDSLEKSLDLHQDAENKHYEKLNEDISKLRERVSALESGVARDREYNSDNIRNKSPLSLTEKGLALLEDSGAKVYLEQNEEKLIEEIKEREPRSAYDVQELSKYIVEKNINTAEFIPLKNYAFAHGVNIIDIAQVISIPLRDKALEALNFDASSLE